VSSSIALTVAMIALMKSSHSEISPHMPLVGSAVGNGLIAFTSTRDGNQEIYVMNADGTAQTNLSNRQGADFEPFFAPDQGARIGFTSPRSGDEEIYLMNSLDGSDQINISHNEASDRSGHWQPLPASPPSGSPIEHVVVLFMENHSFDNTLGLLCVQEDRCDGAITGQLDDGTTIDLSQADDLIPGVRHNGLAQLTAINGGLMNGFSLIEGCTASKNYRCYSQFHQQQIPNLWSLAQTFSISDRTFQLASLPSWHAHLDLVAAQANGFLGTGESGARGRPGCDTQRQVLWQPTVWDLPRLEPSCIPAPDGSGPYRDSPVPWIPTIMDRMDQAGLGWRLYVPGLGDNGYMWAICPSFADCIYTSQADNMLPQEQFVTDAQAGTLPTLSILIPDYVDSQHNGASMLQGDNWIATNLNALMTGPQWSSTAVFITYDDCGCFYDHVPPPPGLSLRMPMVIVSPYAKPAFTDSNIASFASMLAFVEHTFGLAPLSPTDAEAYDYSDSFDYAQSPQGPIALDQHPIPEWEAEWIRAHPPDLEDEDHA
jgi:phospholipase C